MKGKIRIYFIYFLIMVIVIAIAIYFLAFVKLFDPYFLDPSKYKLVRYATCSLVLCANGKGEGQVDKVGCLEYEGGRCVKTCHDIQNELIVRAKDVGEEPKRFCGEKYAIDFEFDSSFPINLRSGEIQTLAKPKWVCRGTSILGSRLSFSEDIESSFRECIMFGNIRGNVQLFWVTEDFEKSDGAGGCFSDSDDRYVFRKVTFTPLIPYEELGKMKIAWDASFPAALYLTDKFTKEEDCQISETGPILAELPDFTKVIANINTIPQCKIKTTDAKGRNKFKVWSDGLRELLLASPVVPTPNSDHCAYTVLDKEQAVYPFTEGKTLSSSREQIFPALVASNGKLYLFFQDADSVNQQAGVFTASGRDSTIVYATSSDGSFASFQGTPIPNLFPYEAVAKVLQPSATLLNGHKYLAYSTNLGKGETYDIMVKDLDGGANLKGGQPERATDDQVSQFNPSITAFDGKLYLFYEQDLPNLPSEIYYKVGTVTGDRVKWSEASLFASGWKNPSAAPTSDGLMITYSFDCGANSPLNGKPSFGGKPRFGQAGKSTESATACENGVGAAIFKDDNFQDAGIVESGSETYGVSRPIAIGSDIFVFFDRGGESKRIFYSKYLGEGKWQESSPAVPYSSRSQVMPSLAEFGGGLTLAFSELGDNYDIRVSSLKGDLAGGSSPVASPPQQSGQESAKSLTISTSKDSYAKGEIVKVTGTLQMASADVSPKGKEISLQLSSSTEIGGEFFFPEQKVTIANDQGNFEWGTNINAVGSYNVVASSGGQESSSEFLVVEPTVNPAPKADLSLKEFSWDGNSKDLRYVVENTGEVDVDGSQVWIRIAFEPEVGEKNFIERILFPEGLPKNFRTMEPGSEDSSSVGLEFFPPIGGKTKFTLTVDQRDQIKELDEDNNVRSLVADLPTAKDGECLQLEPQKGDPKDKLDVVFIPEGYPQSGESGFFVNARLIAQNILNTEPFKSNSDKLNFYYITNKGESLLKKKGDEYSVNHVLTNLYALRCPGFDQKFIVVNDDGRAFTDGPDVAVVFGKVGPKFIGLTGTHEFGHTFGQLKDEYLEGSSYLVIRTQSEVEENSKNFVNCDMEGCPKWCSGVASDLNYKEYSKICSSAKDSEACLSVKDTRFKCGWLFDKSKALDATTANVKAGDKRSCFDIKPGSDINSIDDWHKNNCFSCAVDPTYNPSTPTQPSDLKEDFGVSCKQNTGCFLGCFYNGANLWRSSFNSMMRNEYVEGGATFNAPSAEHIQSLLQAYR